MTFLRSRRIGARGARVALLSETAHLERIWLEETILGTASNLGADVWSIESRTEVTMSINDKEYSTSNYRRLQLPSGCELLLLTIHLPGRKAEQAETTRYALVLIQRLVGDDESALWEIPESAHLVTVNSTEDESLEPFFGRSDLEQLKLLGVR